MNEIVTAVDGYLDVFLGERALPANLVEAIRYALLGGGKRLRPVLAWRSCEAVGGGGEQSLAAGAAVELVHAFSLVHDDLPAMDDDDLRRGRPTLHIKSGEAMAILAGDAMLALAFELIVDRVKSAEPPHLADAMVRELSQATAGMIAGQVYDSLGGLPQGMADLERLHLIHRNKTGALIRAACRMGAMCSGRVEERTLEAITRYAESVGLMFQVVDDLLDIEGTPEQTGKRTRKDAHAGKLTFPGLLGVEASRREVVRLEGEAKRALEILGPAACGLGELASAMASRRH